MQEQERIREEERIKSHNYEREALRIIEEKLKDPSYKSKNGKDFYDFVMKYYA